MCRAIDIWPVASQSACLRCDTSDTRVNGDCAITLTPGLGEGHLHRTSPSLQSWALLYTPSRLGRAKGIHTHEIPAAEQLAVTETGQKIHVTHLQRPPPSIMDLLVRHKLNPRPNIGQHAASGPYTDLVHALQPLPAPLEASSALQRTKGEVTRE